MTTREDRVRELARLYRDHVIGWRRSEPHPDVANERMRALHALYKGMRKTTEGRDAVSSLLADEDVTVRLMAATDSLPWESERAERVIKEIEFGTYGLDSVRAKWILHELRSGTLDLDW